MAEKWKEALDKSGLGAVLLKDLSKSLTCIKHDLMIFKRVAYVYDSPL